MKEYKAFPFNLELADSNVVELRPLVSCICTFKSLSFSNFLWSKSCWRCSSALLASSIFCLCFISSDFFLAACRFELNSSSSLNHFCLSSCIIFNSRSWSSRKAPSASAFFLNSKKSGGLLYSNLVGSVNLSFDDW